MKKFFKEFKTFLSRGNVMQLAIAVIIGAAFGKIISSLVNDIIMPLLSLAVGGMHFTDWKWVIKKATDTTAETALLYCNFIQAVIDFVIIAFCIFLAVWIATKISNKLVKKKPAPPPPPTTEQLLTQIRDILSAQSLQSKENPAPQVKEPAANPDDSPAP